MLFFSSSAATASVLQPSRNTINHDSRLFGIAEPTTGSTLPAPPINIPFNVGNDLTIPSNISSMASHNLETPTSNVISVRCDPTKPINFLSCRGALGYSAVDDEQTTFAQRNTGIPLDIPLPFRITGGKWWPRHRTHRQLVPFSKRSTLADDVADDGRCYIQPFLTGGATSGRASFTNVSRAASAIIQGCVIPRGVGGTAMNIGASTLILNRIT